MNIQRVIAVLGACMIAGTAQAQVQVTITADNGYGFGYGDVNSLANYFGGISNGTAGEIFNCPIGNGPEAYTVPAASAAAGNFLYIIGWADKGTTQGVMGQFQAAGKPPLYTGQGSWEVCATGDDYSTPGTGPSQATIDAWIQKCNLGGGVSQGWVDTNGGGVGTLQFGEDNTTSRPNTPPPGNEFPIVCGVDPDVRWMWYNWDPANILWPAQSPFIWPGGSGNPDAEFLIFRIPAEDVLDPPGTGCMTLDTDRITCDMDAASGWSGTWTWTIDVTNTSGSDASYLLFPDPAVDPNWVPVSLQPGDATQVTVSLSGLAPGEEACFDVVLGDDAMEECCHEEICVQVPACDCVAPDVVATCIPGAPAGTFEATIDLTNLSPDVLEHVFLISQQAGATVTDDYHDIPPTPNGATVSVGPVVVDGADPTVPFCVLATVHDETLAECCSEVICMDVPEPCDGDPTDPTGVGAGVPRSTAIVACNGTGVPSTVGLLGLLAFGLRRRRDAR